jgi:putative drug exporter of the RND superfamily
MQTGEERLGEADLPIQTVESQLAAARQSLQEMTVGRDDSEYEAALAAVEAASTWLTGIDPQTGEDSTATDGVVASVRRAQGQFDLGRYLAGQLEKNGEQAAEGVAKLARGSARLDSGLEKLVDGSREMSQGIDRLSEGGQQLSPGLGRLQEGAERLASGLGLIQNGADGLSDGLRGGARQSDLLTGAVGKIGSAIEEQQGAPGESGLDRLRRQSPGLFRSGYFYLASLDGSPAARRQQAGYLVSIDRGGSAGRMLVIPRYSPSDPRTREVRSRLEADAELLAERMGAEVVVGGVAATQMDIDSELRDQAPYARLALALVTMVILVPVLRSLLVPLMAALLNLLTVAATFGFLALLFDGSLLGGPGYVDTGVLPATIIVVFGLAIDYEIFVFSRMREEYVRTGSAKTAVADGLLRTAPVVTGAAAIMIVVFLSFAVSSFSAMRNFGVAQAIGVAIDAFLIRLVIVPVMMQALGEWAWWMPRWLDRLLPGVPNAAIPSVGGSRR